MTDQAPEPQPARQATSPAAPAETPREKAARLRAEAAEIEASLPPEAGVLRVKVEEPHTFFSYGGVSLGPDFSDVLESQAAAVFQSAAEAGVTLTIQEG